MDQNLEPIYKALEASSKDQVELIKIIITDVMDTTPNTLKILSKFKKENELLNNAMASNSLSIFELMALSSLMQDSFKTFVNENIDKINIYIKEHSEEKDTKFTNFRINELYGFKESLSDLIFNHLSGKHSNAKAKAAEKGKSKDTN